MATGKHGAVDRIIGKTVRGGQGCASVERLLKTSIAQVRNRRVTRMFKKVLVAVVAAGAMSVPLAGVAWADRPDDPGSQGQGKSDNPGSQGRGKPDNPGSQGRGPDRRHGASAQCRQQHQCQRQPAGTLARPDRQQSERQSEQQSEQQSERCPSRSGRRGAVAALHGAVRHDHLQRQHPTVTQSQTTTITTNGGATGN